MKPKHFSTHKVYNTGRTRIKKGQRLSPATEFKKGSTHSVSKEVKEKLRLAALKQHIEGRCRGGMEAKKRRNAEREKRALAGVRPSECQICGETGKICFDHDHKTDKFRGWICWRCNVVLGFVKDDTELLIKLSIYLKRQ